MKRITTHILNTSQGKPAANIDVQLLVQRENTWETLDEERTDTDGRTEFAPADTNGHFQAGNYKIKFFTEPYFKQQQIDTFYPWVEIMFKLSDNAEHYHIPLLISPFGFTTYRGS